MPTFLHLADVHLDAPLCGLERYPGAPVERVRAATRDAFVRAMDLALDERVAAVVLAGDVYDGALADDAACGLWLAAQLRRLREAEIPVLLLVGNHDAECSFRRHVTLPDGVHTLPTDAPATKAYEHLGLAFHGQSYPTRHVTTNLAAAYPAPVPGLLNVGVLHTAMEGRGAHPRYAPCTADELRRRGYAYWALGHVHAREVVARDPWIVFPGNLQGRGLHEDGPKGCTLVSYEGDRVTSIEHRPCDVVRWETLRVDATGAADLDELVRRAEVVLDRARGTAQGRLLAARLDVVGGTPAHRRLVQDGVRARAELQALAGRHPDVWLADVTLRTRPELHLGALRVRDDAIGAVAAPIDADHGLTEVLAALASAAADLSAVVPADLQRELPTTPADLQAGLEDAQAQLLGLLLDAGEETT